MFELKNLPYEYNALEPLMSEETLKIHHTKHHQAYCDNFNKAIKDNALENQSIEEIFSKISTLPKAVENHGGGFWNHQFFWEGLTESFKEAEGDILEKINHSFGDMESFKSEFSKKAATVFGSGWAWLCINEEGDLEIVQTFNQENPLMDTFVERKSQLKPLLTIDVWEHAYYVDYQNRRAEFIENFFKLINWQKVQERLNS